MRSESKPGTGQTSRASVLEDAIAALATIAIVTIGILYALPWTWPRDIGRTTATAQAAAGAPPSERKARR